ncbi:MAG TPA: ABC transporter substrate-binding protein [Alphaproteobacteria bacterium]|nr:ABC transporter substrate-binding protein [Alphaproteobacteria bacterium]
MRSRFGTWRWGTAAVAALVLGAASASAQTVKVGVVLTYSGPQASLGDQIDKGFSLYIKEHTKDLPAGVKVELVKRDDTGPNPEVAKRLATELVTRDHVQFITGVVWTPNAAAIAPVAGESKTPFVDMNASGAALTRLTPYMVRVSFTQWHTALAIGTWSAKNGSKTAYTAVSDFVPGHDAEAAFIKGYTDAGGKIVGSVRFPLQSPDFAPFIQRVKDAHPDTLYVFVPSGAQATAVMKAYADLGLKDAGIKLVGPMDLVPDYELPNMGNAPLGLITSGNYSSAATRPQNKAFVEAWHKAYGDKSVPDFMAVGGWDGMAAIFSVIEQTKGKFTGEQAMDILKSWKNPDSPRGPISIDPATRDIVQNIYIRRTEMVDGHLANVEFDTLPNIKDPWKELNPAK